ncbi:MAG TPA: SAF domain-containing protein [Gaiellaceae bacterium]|nr:SAF domain-containing protein [Gaiellaceae bacterium]
MLARKTAFGEASIWAAPSYNAPSRCTWLKVGRAVWGGMCRRYQPPGRGLLDVVPLRLPIKGRIFNVLWGQVGTAVATVMVRFKNGSEISVPLSKRIRPARRGLGHVALQRVFLFAVPSSQWGVDFLSPLPSSQWGVDDRPALLIARDRSGRTVGRPLLFEYALLKFDRRLPLTRPVSGARFPPLLAERNAWPATRPKEIQSRGTVLVAKRLISKGTSWSSIAGQNLFVVVTIPKGQIAPTAISNPAVLQGRVAAGDIHQHQQLTMSDFTTPH